MLISALSNNEITDFCDFFDRHIDWLKNGWANDNPWIQAVYEISTPHHAEFVKRRNGYGDMEISYFYLESFLEAHPHPFADPLILSVDKTSVLNELLINSASFFEGEVRRISDCGLPDYHFEPHMIRVKNKTQLRAEIKKYGAFLQEKYSGNYGKLYLGKLS